MPPANNTGRRTTLGDLLNPIDRLVAYFSAEGGLKRIQQRHALGQLQARAHEAAAPSQYRKYAMDRQGPNGIVQESALALRIQARHYVRNHDMSRGIVRTLVNNVIGANGIGTEPTPRRADGSIHKEFAAQISSMQRLWMERPEVSRRFHFAKCQRMMGWTWFRDGEGFSQDVIGFVPGLKHSTALPYSLELIEPDFAPLDYSDPNKGIVQAAERNAWGQIVAWWFYKNNPNELTGTTVTSWQDLKRVDAGRIKQLASLDHIGQIRGMTEFASILTRLADIKDYEESERIAAKVAASLTAFIKKTAGPEGFDSAGLEMNPDGTFKPRNIHMSPGMIIDGLAVGEDIGMIDSNRPNPNLVTFRQGQLKAVAAGIGGSYSSISKSYDGTFSAQRQELVEQWVNYAVLTDEFTGQWLQPVHKTMVSVGLLSGVLKMPADVVPETADDALFTAQSMPWIDPYKEAIAWVMLARAGFASEIEVLRRRGVNPRDYLEQSKSWREETENANLVYTSNAKNGATVEAPTGGAGQGGDGAQAAAAAAAAAN